MLSLQDFEVSASIAARADTVFVDDTDTGHAAGVFTYSAANTDGAMQTYIGLLMVDGDGIGLISLSARDAGHLADSLTEGTQACGTQRTTLRFANDRGIPAIDALGWEVEDAHEPKTDTIAVEVLRNDRGDLIVGLETCGYDPMGEMAIAMDAANTARVVNALQNAIRLHA